VEGVIECVLDGVLVGEDEAEGVGERVCVREAEGDGVGVCVSVGVCDGIRVADLVRDGV